MSQEPLPPSIRVNANDRIQAVLRALASAIDTQAPGLGSVFGELLTTILPANRQERIALFVAALDRRVRSLDARLATIISGLEAEQEGLLEDGIRSSARASAVQRIEQIASVVATGLTEAKAAVRQREVLDLMSRLSDHDLATLSHFLNGQGMDTYRTPTLTLGQWERMSEDEKDAANERDRLRELSITKLISSGLLDQRYRLLDDPPWDIQKVVEGEIQLSQLGYFFARHIGLWPDGAGPPHLFR